MGKKLFTVATKTTEYVGTQYNKEKVLHKNNKILSNDINKILNKGKAIPYSWMERHSIYLKSSLLELIYIFNAIPNRILTVFLRDR